MEKSKLLSKWESTGLLQQVKEENLEKTAAYLELAAAEMLRRGDGDDIIALRNTSIMNVFLPVSRNIFVAGYNPPASKLFDSIINFWNESPEFDDFELVSSYVRYYTRTH